MKTTTRITDCRRPQELPFAGLALLLVLLCLTAVRSSAQNYRVLHEFTGAEMGRSPWGGMVLGAGDHLYGTTHDGSPLFGSWNGTVFKIRTDGSGHIVLKRFNGTDGRYPLGDLLLQGDTLFGTTEQGGNYGAGNVFRLRTDGSAYTLLHQFNPPDYTRNPNPGLVLLGSFLYGTTYFGTIYRVDTNGSGYMSLKVLSGTNGSHMLAGFVTEGTALYGTTSRGGLHDRGTVFKINTDGSGHTILKHFTGTDGDAPRVRLLLSGMTLYGTTSLGGKSNRGTVFRVNTDGTGYSVLKHFGGYDGDYPIAGLILSATTLYGTTRAGGTANCGTVFQVNTDGGGYDVLKHFEGSDGANPAGGLVLAGFTLYGTAVYGGISNNGVVFGLSGSPTIVAGPQSLTIEEGGTVTFTVDAVGFPGPLSYQWYLNETDALPGATHSVLGLTNAPLSASGSYTVVITNKAGVATSSPAMLTVIPLGTVPVASCTEAALRAALGGPGPVTFACDGTITLSSTITITNDTVLDGNGHQVTISGNEAVRVFHVSTNVHFTLRNLTIANGRGEPGGAVCNEGGTVTATNCVFSGNTANGQIGMEYGGDGTPGTGGAIYNAGIFHANVCSFVGNSAIGGQGAAGDYWGMKPEGMGGFGGQAMGGAVYNLGSVIIERSLFASNSVVGGDGGQGWNAFRLTDQRYYGGPGGGAGGAEGAALFSAGPSALVNCTVAGNQSIGGDGGRGGNGTTWDIPHGGGVEYTSGGAGGNGGGGGGAIHDRAAWIELVNCTVALNSSQGGAGGNGGLDGGGGNAAPNGANGLALGGIETQGGVLKNTLLANNMPTNSTGFITVAGHNLSSDDSCAFTNVTSLNNTDPKLGPLANNGGPTLTMALLPGSPAIDTGDTVAAPPTDQRGVPRPYGQTADIGAFEYWLSAQAMHSPSGGVDIVAWGIAGQSCCLLVSPDLTTWTATATNQIGVDGTVLFHDEAIGPSSRFYRFMLQ